MTPTTVLEVAGQIALGNYTRVRKLNLVTQLKGKLTLVQVKLFHILIWNLIIKLMLISQRIKIRKSSMNLFGITS